jgi:hypothetical protein
MPATTKTDADGGAVGLPRRPVDETGVVAAGIGTRASGLFG